MVCISLVFVLCVQACIGLIVDTTRQTVSTLVVMLCMKTHVDLNGESFICSLAVNHWAQISASTG